MGFLEFFVERRVIRPLWFVRRQEMVKRLLLSALCIAAALVFAISPAIFSGEEKEAENGTAGPSGDEEKADTGEEEKADTGEAEKADTGSAGLSVTIGDITFKIEKVAVENGWDVVSTPEEIEKRKKDESSLPKGWKEFAEEHKKGLQDYAKKMAKNEEAKFIENLNPLLKYVVISFSVVCKGDTKPLYASPTVFLDSCLVAENDKGTVLPQARLFPHERPEHWLERPVFEMQKGKEAKDRIIFRAPDKKATSVKAAIRMNALFPGRAGKIVINVPFKEEKPADLDKVTVSFEEPEKAAEPKKKLKIRGKGTFGKFQIFLEGVEQKTLHYYDKKFVQTSENARTVVTIRVKNRDSKPVKYKPMIYAATLNGIAIDGKGALVNMMGFKEDVKILECYSIVESIPAKGEIKDSIIMSGVGMEKLRLILIPDTLLDTSKPLKGVLMCDMEFEGTDLTEARVRVIKKTKNINPKVLEQVLEASATQNSQSWEKKFVGHSITGWGEVGTCNYNKETNTTYVTVFSSKTKDVAYGYYLIIPNDAATYNIADKIAFKGIIVMTDAERSEVTGKLTRQLIILATRHGKGR
jgi:hypothetical protein